MYRDNFTTGEHDAKRRRHLTYELATAFPERYMRTGHKNLNGTMTTEYGIPYGTWSCPFNIVAWAFSMVRR